MEQRLWFTSAEVRYANCARAVKWLSKSYSLGKEPVEFLLKVLLIKTLWRYTADVGRLVKTIEERHLDFTLDDVFSRIRSEAADAPRIIHLIFDDIDGLSYFIPGTQPALLSQMVEILASVQARHPSLVIIPMFISARGPSLMNCGARTSRSVCEIEMRPMSDQTIQAIIKGRLQKKNGTFEESWKRYLWQFGGCPALAVHAGYARPELGIECAKVGFYDRKAAGDPEIMLCMALVGYPIDPSL